MKPPGSRSKAPVFPPEKIISYRQFIADFATSHRIGGAHPFCFLIGAGASRDAGIPTGSQFANTWLREIFQTEGPADKRLPAPDTVQGEKAADRIIRLSAFLPDEEKRLGEWAENHLAPEPDFAGFAWKNRAAFYGALYARRYRTNSDLGQADLRGVIIGARPTAAYLLLARILADTKHRLVVTTNFDRLTEDAVAIIKGTAALTLGHEKIAPFLDTAYELPMVAKVHGDIFLETYNAENDIRNLRAEWQDALRRVLQSHTPIIIGYGGNDPGLMKFLAENADACFRRRAFYWLYHEPTGVPENDLVHKLAKTHGFRLVPVPGFEHTMQALNDALGFPPLLDDIAKISASLRAQIESPDGKAGKGGRGASSESIQSSSEVSSETMESISFKEGSTEREALDRGRELIAKGEYRQAEPLLRKLHENMLRTHGADSPLTLEAAHQLGRVLYASGDLAGAEPLVRQTLETRERVLGPEHPDTLTSLNNLGNLLSDKDDLAGAEALYRRVLETRERTLGPEHPDTLGSLNNLGVLLKDKGDLDGAESLYRRALEMRERTVGPEHPETLTSMNNLGVLLKNKGDLLGAEALYRRALEMRERVLGPEHPDTLASIHCLGTLHSDKGDLSKAEELLRQALAGYEKVLLPEHPWRKIAEAALAKIIAKRRAAREGAGGY